MVERLLRPLILYEGWERNKADLTITTPAGGKFAVKSADRPETLVGEGLDTLVIDEAGIVKEQAWIESLRPALADRLGRAILIGTPKGRNWFWRAYQHSLYDEHPDWQGWRFPTVSNPFIAPQEVETARRENPERTFRQEWLAEFLESEGTVFRNIKACIIPPIDRPMPSGDVVFGIDWGRHNDYTAIVALDRQTRHVLAVDRFTEISYPLQLARVKSLAAEYKPYLIMAETNSMGLPNIEALQREGLPVQAFTTTNKSKQEIIEALVLAFERADIRIPKHAPLIAELEAFEQTPTALGYRYGHPTGAHDDTVMALALAWHAALRSRVGVRFFD